MKAALIEGTIDPTFHALRIPYAVLVREGEDDVVVPHRQAMAEIGEYLLRKGLVTGIEASGFMHLALSYGLLDNSAAVIERIAAATLPSDFSPVWQIQDCNLINCQNPFPHAKIVRRKLSSRMMYPLYSIEVFLSICFRMARHNEISPDEIAWIVKSLKKMQIPRDQAEIDEKLRYLPAIMRENFDRYVEACQKEMLADMKADRIVDDMEDQQDPQHFPGISATEQPN